MKNCDQCLALYRKLYKIGPYCEMRIGDRTQAFERYHFQQPSVKSGFASRITFGLKFWPWRRFALSEYSLVCDAVLMYGGRYEILALAEVCTL